MMLVSILRRQIQSIAGMETAKTMRVVGNVIQAIAGLTGPCCCKAFVRVALAEAVSFAREFFAVSLAITDMRGSCMYVSRHPHGCRKEKCLYY